MDVNSLCECSICGNTVAEEDTTIAFGDAVCDKCNAKYNKAKAQQAIQRGNAPTKENAT